MHITKKSEVEINKTYYYADSDSPNLEHQADGVYICSCIWSDMSEKYNKNYGTNKKDMFVFLTNKIILFVGRNQYNKINMYMEIDWIKSRNFYTTVDEAYRDAISQTFKWYAPFKE